MELIGTVTNAGYLTLSPHSGRSPQEGAMGRPNLNVKPISVNLPVGMPERIDALVGRQKRSEFIREALEGALRVAEIATKSVRTPE